MQVARAKGARVLATAGSDKIALLCDLGVVEAIDDTTTRFEDVAREVDVVVDTVAGDLTARSLAVLKPGGISVTAAGQPDAAAAAARGVRARGKRAQPDATDRTAITSLIDAGPVSQSIANARKALVRSKQATRVVDVPAPGAPVTICWR